MKEQLNHRGTEDTENDKATDRFNWDEGDEGDYGKGTDFEQRWTGRAG